MENVNVMKTEKEIVRLLEDKSFQMQNLCRTCLKDNMEMKYSLFESESDGDLLCSNITQLTGVVLEPQDRGLPGYMCGECHELLSLANSFKVKCQYSDDLLKKVLIGNNKSSLEQLLTVDRLKIESTEEKHVQFNNEEIKDENSLEIDESACVVKKKCKKLKTRDLLSNRESTLLPEDRVMSLDNIKQEIDDNFDSGRISHCSDEDDNNDLSENIQLKDSKEFVKIGCKICKKLLSSKLSLQKHMKNYHGNAKSNIRVPYKIEGYGKDRNFLCTFCEYACKRKQGIVGHIRTHTGEKPYSCVDCGMYFPTTSALSNHRKVHSDQMNHICPQCGKQFKMKSKYEQHKLVHTTEKKFQCHKCNKLLKSKSTLQMHMYRHDNIKNYSCEACGATFVTCSELISHSKSHGGEKKFHCTICNLKTTTKTALELHLLRHSGERKFECSLCDAKHYTATALKSHMIRHTKEKRYPCLYCEQKFAHSSSLNRHMLKSHEKKCKWLDMVDRRIVK